MESKKEKCLKRKEQPLASNTSKKGKLRNCDGFLSVILFPKNVVPDKLLTCKLR